MPRATCCPRSRPRRPRAWSCRLDFDQSVFVRAAVTNVVREAVDLLHPRLADDPAVPGGLAQRPVVVSLSIPLSIWRGMIGLLLTGQSINLMTLGGLALAIGLLVDNATVTIENIHRNQTLGKGLTLGDPGWVGRGDPAPDRGDARHLHRFLSGGAAGRPGALPLHSAGHHGGAGDAGFLLLSFTVVPAFSRFF